MDQKDNLTDVVEVVTQPQNEEPQASQDQPQAGESQVIDGDGEIVTLGN